MERRTFLKVAGVGGATAAGSAIVVGGGALVDGTDSTDGPPAQGDWTLTFEDRFEGDSLDSDKWGIGWGWGWGTDTSSTRTSPENVAVRDGRLRLTGTHHGDRYVSGTVNTKNLLSIEPGTHVAARIKFAPRVGFLNAFWAKPISEVWPPEIDVVELFPVGDGRSDTRETHHHLHYSTSTEPGDESTYTEVDVTSEPGGNLGETFHVYGLEWQADRLVHYVDGQPVQEWTDETLLAALDIGVPFYLILSLNIGSIAQPDTSESWDEEMVVDWVRAWELP